MILDNFAGHPHLHLSNVKMFLPPNTTSITQLMDAGIIKNMKHHYRKLLVQRRISCIDSEEEEFRVTVLDALQWLKMAWQQVTPETNKNCYRHVGFGELPAEETNNQPTNRTTLMACGKQPVMLDWQMAK